MISNDSLKVHNYSEFVKLLEKYKVIPFSNFIPDYPSLASAASDCHWHTDDVDSDPWTWRIKIVNDGIAAYGRFFGDKGTFIHASLFPYIRHALTSGRTIKQRYNDGIMSTSAYRLYNILDTSGNIDSRNLRKAADLDQTEQKKEYEKSLIELQNYGDIVITGSRGSDNNAGWKSMCYELSDSWLNSIGINNPVLGLSEAKKIIVTELQHYSTEKSNKYFSKKLMLG